MNTNLGIENIEVFPGYIILEEVHKSQKHLIYRAKRKKDNLEVIIKTFIDKYLKKEDLLKIQREFQITNKLKVDSVISCYDLIPYGTGNLAIIFESFGISLNNYLLSFENKIIPLDEFLPLAIKIAEVGKVIHEKGIVHNNIEPSNMMV